MSPLTHGLNYRSACDVSYLAFKVFLETKAQIHCYGAVFY